MNKITKEFISSDNQHYKFKIGRLLASSLSGFVAGIIFATIIWGIVIAQLLSR